MRYLIRAGIPWLLVLSTVFSLSSKSFAADQIPDCYSGRTVLQINNEEVLTWKRETQNGTTKRGHIRGAVTRIFPDRTDHAHFEINIGKSNADTIEVIYNKRFGELPNIAENMEVEACGDYITAHAKNGPYPPSPSGAIIHWIHFSPDLKRHASGYLVIDGRLYGDNISRAKPRKGKRNSFQ